MKTALTKFTALGSIALLMLISCKKNDPIIKTNGGTAGTLTSSEAMLTLDKTKLTDTTKVISFSFSKPVYGYSAAVTNTLEIDSAGDSWKKPISVTLGTNILSQSYNTADFNSILLKLNLPAGKPSQVQVRIEHSIGTGAAPIYSNVLNLTVTPFNLSSWLYVVGQFDGWPSVPKNGADSLLSTTSNGVYTGIINFPAGNNQFLILPESKDYNNKYATTDPTGSTSSTVKQNAGNNFYAPAAAGQYIVTLNLNTNTISFQAADYYSLIGNDFAGQSWNTDNFMKYVNDGSGSWTITIPMIAPAGGGFKIRQDAAWSNSWGFLHTPDGATLTNATGNTGASNMSIPAAGTYKVTFVMPATAFGTNTTIPVTAPYTITQQ